MVVLLDSQHKQNNSSFRSLVVDKKDDDSGWRSLHQCSSALRLFLGWQNSHTAHKKQWFCFRISGERRRKNHKFRANVVFNNLLSSQSISKNMVNSRLTTISAILLRVKADKKRKNWAGHRRVRNMQLQQKTEKWRNAGWLDTCSLEMTTAVHSFLMPNSTLTRDKVLTIGTLYERCNTRWCGCVWPHTSCLLCATNTHFTLTTQCSLHIP